MSKPVYEVGDEIINTEYIGFVYEIVDRDKQRYKYKITAIPRDAISKIGGTDWCSFKDVEGVTRKLTKLDKALK